MKKDQKTISLPLKIILTAAGIIALALGVIGIFLPVLPTVPFLLASLFCFARGSETFDARFRASRIYKNHLKNFLAERNMTLRAKLCILLPASAMIAAACILAPWLHLRIFLITLLIFKYVYFFTRIKTKERGSGNTDKPDRNG